MQVVNLFLHFSTAPYFSYHKVENSASVFVFVCHTGSVTRQEIINDPSTVTVSHDRAGGDRRVPAGGTCLIHH